MKKEMRFQRMEEQTIDPDIQGAQAGFAEKSSLPSLESLVGSSVIDPSGEEIGKLYCVWENDTHMASFLGIKTGWFGLGSIHAIPADFAEYSQTSNRIRVPFSKDVIKDAPSYQEEDEMSSSRQSEIFNYYNSRQPGYSEHLEQKSEEPLYQGAQSRDIEAGERLESEMPREEARIRLHEEQLKVGKRDVQVGGVRLRKIVRSETVQQPVELKREELVVENVPPSQASTSSERAFEGEEMFIPLRAEEPVIQKEIKVKEEVLARKEAVSEHRDVTENIRSEDLQTQKEGRVEEESRKNT